MQKRSCFTCKAAGNLGTTPIGSFLTPTPTARNRTRIHVPVNFSTPDATPVIPTETKQTIRTETSTPPQRPIATQTANKVPTPNTTETNQKSRKQNSSSIRNSARTKLSTLVANVCFCFKCARQKEGSFNHKDDIKLSMQACRGCSKQM